MADFGIETGCTHYSIQPAELAGWAESHGFESLWFGEHTHIPTSSPPPGVSAGGEVPQFYKEVFDPFVELTAAAAVTTSRRIESDHPLQGLGPKHCPRRPDTLVDDKEGKLRG